MTIIVQHKMAELQREADDNRLLQKPFDADAPPPPTCPQPRSRRRDGPELVGGRVTLRGSAG
jgi:hypothetical protein